MKYLEGRRLRRSLFQQMNKEVKQQIEPNEQWVSLFSKFDSKEWCFVDGKLTQTEFRSKKMLPNEVKIRVENVILNEYEIKSSGKTNIHEFAGEIIATGSKIANFKVGDKVVGKDPFRNCFKETICITEKHIKKLPNNVKSYECALGHMSTSVLPYDLLTNALTINESDTVLILHGENVISKKCAEILKSMKRNYYMVVPPNLFNKYKKANYNVIEDYSITPTFLENINVVVDVSDDCKFYDDLSCNTTYVHLSIEQKHHKGLYKLAENEEKSLSDSEGHATMINFSCPSNLDNFFDCFEKVSQIIKPHIDSIISVNEVELVEDCFKDLETNNTEKNIIINLQ